MKRRVITSREIIEGNTIIHSLAAVHHDENELKRQMKACTNG